MSVFMGFYKVLSDVDYLGTVENETDEGSMDFVSVWSDEKEHTKFDVTYYSRIYKGYRGIRTFIKNIRNLPIKKYSNNDPKYIDEKDTIRYIALDRIVEYSGWFFKDSYFKKKVWLYVATTKKQILKFMARYMDFRKHPELYKELKDFLDNEWKDGMFFYCSW